MTIALNDKGLPILNQFADEQMVNTIFKISAFEDLENSYRFNISAVYEETEVGIGVKIVKGIKAGFDANMTVIEKHMCTKGITFINTGKHSDALLTTLAKLYGFEETDGVFMVQKEHYSAIALHQGKVDMLNQPLKMKLFGKDAAKDPQEQYNESYLMIDFKAGWVCWNEKDPEYREALILSLLK